MKIKYLLPSGILIAGFIVGSSFSFAKVEYTKKEKKACTFCHVKPGSKELNDAGKYYQDHNNSLEGYEKK